MSRPIWFDPAARNELLQAVAFYDAEYSGLGGAFLDALEHALGQLQAFPESSPVLVAPLRTKVVAAFPFSVIYWVTDGAIIVVAVAHHRRRPGYWQGRE